ncbi:hypothetical protein MKW92_038512 [Papaver armeniacum]|nr:hypothetical protein MKW92_038512 [Papaver armeniacum]
MAEVDVAFVQPLEHRPKPNNSAEIVEGISKFFHLSPEERRKVKRDETNPLGCYDTEHTKNVRDWKEVFDFSVKDPMVLPASC